MVRASGAKHFSFTTAEPLPDPPTLVYPSDNSTDVPT